MNLGILMSLFNQRYFRDKLSTICEFIPQVRLRLHQGHAASCVRQRLPLLRVSCPGGNVAGSFTAFCKA